MINLMDLSDKIILITGASSGIGKETAILLSKLGAKTILVGRSTDKLDETYSQLEGSGHKSYGFDLKNIGNIDSFIKKIIDENGRLDGFVHSAGVSAMRPLKMTNYNFLHDMMLINFYSFIELTRCITLKTNFNENLSIVAMSSISGIQGFKSKTAYSASKAAIDGAIRSLAKELAVKKIRINSIIAGFVKTEMFDRFNERTSFSESEIEFSKYILGLPYPSDIAKSICFLLSKNSMFITGNSIKIDSGYTC